MTGRILQSLASSFDPDEDDRPRRSTMKPDAIEAGAFRQYARFTRMPNAADRWPSSQPSGDRLGSTSSPLAWKAFEPPADASEKSIHCKERIVPSTTPAIPYHQMIETTRAVLAQRFPVIRPKRSHQPKAPLAIGIHKEIVAAAPDLDPKHVKLTIRDYVTGPKYLKAVINGGPRFSLDGLVSGAVTQPQQEHAAHALKVFRQREKSRRPKTKVVAPESVPTVAEALQDAA